MPKSAKKRKEKAADFAKAKLRLGKSKQQPSNVVDTSFKAKSIALPSQSISAARDPNEPTTRRRLTFDDLLTQLKHHNTNTRKEAMLGLQELFQANPGLFQLKLTALLNACARLISDDDAGIRRSLLAFLNWSLPLVRQEDLLPHAHTLLLYTTSAQTHIFPEIRLDAIRILDTLLDYIPTAVVEGWAGSGNAHGGRILRGYLNMLNAGTAADRSIATPTTAVVLSPQSRSIVLRSLSKFLHQCLAQHGLGSQLNVSPTGCVDPLYMKYFFATSDAYHTFSQFLKPRFNTPQTYWADDLEFGQCTFPPNLISLVSPTGQWPLTQLMDIGDDGDDEAVRQSIDHSFLQDLVHSLTPIIVSNIVECAPMVFSSGTNVPEQEAELLLAVLQIARNLFIPLLLPRSGDFNCGDIETILGYLSPYFPFHPPSSRDNKFAQAFQQANIAFCELAALASLPRTRNYKTGSNNAPHPLPQQRHQQKRAVVRNQAMGNQPKATHIPALVEYVTQLLRGEAVIGIGRPLSASLYYALLPTLWALICISKDDTRDNILNILLEHGSRVSATSPVKGISTHFIGHLVLLGTEPQYQGDLRFKPGDKCLEEWLCHLPKCLWELGNSNPMTTEIILRLLLRLHQRGSQAIHPKLLSSLHPMLTPFFTVHHPTKGRLEGPFHKLPLPHQKLALDVAYMLSSKDLRDRALMMGVTEAVAGKPTQEYWNHILGI